MQLINVSSATFADDLVTPCPPQRPPQLKDGDHCLVVAGTHKGASGIASDLRVSKTGHLTITVVQANGERVKTLGRNVVVDR